MAHYLFPASLYQRLIGALLVLALLPLPIAANAAEQNTAATQSPAGSRQISETGAPPNPGPAESNRRVHTGRPATKAHGAFPGTGQGQTFDRGHFAKLVGDPQGQ